MRQIAGRRCIALHCSRQRRATDRCVAELSTSLRLQSVAEAEVSGKVHVIGYTGAMELWFNWKIHDGGSSL